LLDLHEERGQFEIALSLVVRGATEMPLAWAMWDRAEALARRLKRPDEVASLYQRVLGQSLTQSAALALGERAALFYEEWFEDSGRIVGILERVLEIDPTAQWAFDRLKLLFDAAERWDDLFALYDRALDAADDEKKKELLDEAAQVAKDFAGRPDRAIGYLEQLLVLKPNDARLSSSLERLYERHARHRELVALLTTRLPALAAKDAYKTRARIASLWIDEIHDASSALVVVEEMLAADAPAPATGAAAGDVSGLLERILAAAPANVEIAAPSSRHSEPPTSKRGKRASIAPRRSESIPPPKRISVRQRAAALLKERYAQPGNEASLVRVLEVELEAIKSAKERIRRHQQLAALHTSLDNDAAALEQYVALVTLEPEVAAHRDKLAELAAKVGRFDRLADVLAAAADECDDDALRVELLMQAGIVQADRIGDADRAIDLLARIVDTPNAAPQAVLAAAKRVEPLLATARRARERLHVIEKIATLENDAALRKSALGDAARLATELEENARAVQAWEARVADDASDLEALDGLSDLLERSEGWKRLAEVLALRAAAGATDDAKRADRVRIARIAQEKLDDTGMAIAAWREVEALFGDSDDTTDALAALFQKAQRWDEMAAVLERGASHATASAARAEFLRRLGDVQRDQLERKEAAVSSYAASLEADPANAGARAGLHTLLADAAQRRAAVAVLMTTYTRTDDWTLILELTAHRLAAAESDAARLEVLLHAAKLGEERAGDAALAFEAMRSAFLLGPSDTRVGAELARLAEATRAWKSYVDAHAEAIAALESDARSARLVAELRVNMADALDRKLDDPRAALASYLRVIADAPPALDAARAAIRVAARQERWDAVAHVLVDCARATGQAEATLRDEVEGACAGAAAWDTLASALTTAIAEEKEAPHAVSRDLEAQLAAWHRDKRGDSEAAEAAFARALAHDPLHEDILGALATLQRRDGGRPLVDTLLRLSQARRGDLELLREAAEIAQRPIGDAALAKSILERLLKLARDRWLDEEENGPPTLGNPVAPGPFAAWSLEELARMHENEGDHARVVELLMWGSELPFEREKNRELRARAAAIAEAKLGEIDRAVTIHERLFEDDPHDAAVVAALARLYESNGRTRELLKLRERQVAVAKSAEARLPLRLAVARLLASLGESERALGVLRENLAESPRDRDTSALLASQLEADARTTELRDLFRDQAALAEKDGDATAAAELWYRAAVACESKLADNEAAAELYARVVALAPHAESYDALARLASARGDHDRAAEHLEKLRDLVDEAARAEVTLRLVDALTAAGRDDQARARLEQATEAHPKDESIRARLAQLYRERSDWPKLARLLAAAASHAPDKSARLARLRDAAAIHRQKCDEPHEAVPLLEQACDLEPNEQAIRLALADALGAAGRFDDARALLKTLIDAFGGRRPKERAPVHYQLAQLELAMGNRARALVELDSATRIDPANPEILRTLAELARDDGQLERAEKSYRALLVVLRRQEEDGPIARSEVLLELSAIAARQNDGERAREIKESALEAATRSDFEEERLEQTLRAHGDFETLARAFDARLARSGDSPSTAKATCELAEVLAEKLGRLSDAVPIAMRALALAPSQSAVHDTALALARRAGAIERYVEALRSIAERAESSGDAGLACSALVRLGAACESDLSDAKAAAAIYERALGLGVRTGDVLRALDAVYERLGDTDAQGRVLARRFELESKGGDPKSASDALYRLAALRLASAQTIEEGCDLLAKALERDADLDRAEASLRAAAEIAPKNTRVLALYEEVGRSPGHERALVDALTRRADLPGYSADSMREAIEVARGIGDDALAESLLTRFLEGDRTANQNAGFLAWAMETLGKLREAAGDLRAAVTLKKSAAQLAEPDDARRLAFDVARLAEGSLDDLALAAATYEGLRTRDPADREAWEPLIAVYRRIGDAEKLASLIAGVVDYVDDPDERSKLRLLRVKIVLDDLHREEEAATALREIVDDDPSQVDAAMLLANLLEKAGRADDLADLLSKQLDAAKDRSDAAKVAVLALRLGKLLEKSDPVAARNVYYTGLDWDGQSRELLRALLKVLEGGDASERADAMEKLLAIESGPDAEKLALALHTMRVDQWDDAGAERALELGYKAHPASFVLKQRLEAAYRDRREWSKLADLFVVDASARADVAEKIERLREAATLHRRELSDPKRAAEVLAQAVAVAPEDAALLDELVTLLAEANEHAWAERELSAAIDRTKDAAARARLLARRAAIESAHGDDDAALFDLEQAYAIAPAHHARALASQLERVVAAASRAQDRARERGLLLRLVDVLIAGKDADGARAILAELLKHDGKDRDALRALAGVESQQERWDAASAAYRRLVALEEGDALVETALRLADACERANRFADARGGLERARMSAPANEALKQCLERLYEATGAHKELAEMLLADAKSMGDVAGRFAQLLRAGSLLMHHGGDPDAAIAALKEAQALRPNDPECIALLGDAYTLAGRTVEAADILGAAISAHKGRRSRELASLYHRMARVALADGETTQQVAWLTQALDMDSQNGLVASELAQLAMDLNQLDLANRALRVVTMLKNAGPMSKALAYQYMGEIARKQGDPKRAVLLVKRAIQEDGTLASAKALLQVLQHES
jgi:tetratricopeptide (TPR) repeat protein